LHPLHSCSGFNRIFVAGCEWICAAFKRLTVLTELTSVSLTEISKFMLRITVAAPSNGF